MGDALLRGGSKVPERDVRSKPFGETDLTTSPSLHGLKRTRYIIGFTMLCSQYRSRMLAGVYYTCLTAMFLIILHQCVKPALLCELKPRRHTVPEPVLVR